MSPRPAGRATGLGANDRGAAERGADGGADGRADGGADGRGAPAVDLAIAGAGPAGLALAGAASAHGLRVVVLAPDPLRAWHQTYGTWVDEVVDAGLRLTLGVVHDDVVAVGHEAVRVDRRYGLFDTVRLQAALLARCRAGVDLRAVAVRGAHRAPEGGWTVELDGGATLSASLVADATGAARVLIGAGDRARSPQPAAEQVAHGVVLDRDEAGIPAGHATFMDWRPEHGEAGDPTFLYALDLGDGRALLEETSLARRPGLDPTVLERRLHARLRARGIRVPRDTPVEQVRFALDAPVPPSGGPLAIGAAGGLVHPASGYSVAASLAVAEPLAAALAGGLDRGGPDLADARARAELWPPTARLARAVHHRGLAVLLGLDPELVPGFFDAFLSLPVGVWSRYLAARPDLAGSLRAMTALWRTAPPPLRVALVRGALR